ncbi:MAG: TlpA disulfide reductase family protein [Burkholderiaceae bacterium]
MNTRRQLILFALIGTLGLAAGLGAAWWKQSVAASSGSRALFTRSFPDTEGKEQPLDQWRGQVLVINFWATWCPPCIREMPDLQKVADDYRDRGVQVIGLGIDNPTAIHAFQAQYQLRLPILVAGFGGSELSQQLGNASGALPYTVLVDRQGRIVQTRLGQINPAELRRWIDQQI